jgi:hypothetical protein
MIIAHQGKMVRVGAGKKMLTNVTSYIFFKFSQIFNLKVTYVTDIEKMRFRLTLGFIGIRGRFFKKGVEA